MNRLTDEQIEAAAKAIFLAPTEGNENTSSWNFDTLPFAAKDRYRIIARAAAPFLQMPWEIPTSEEMVDGIRNGSVGGTSEALIQFIKRRNAALLPKPVDPRRAKILAALMEHTPNRTLRYEDMADLILATLDAKEWPCPNPES